MLTCPTCEKTFPDDAATCPDDGAVLLPAAMFASMDRGLAPGTLVGEYRIEGKLGEGGFGVVYRAVHPLIGKAAAIKVLNREFSSNAQMVSRFIAEARAVNQIRHRNIIDVFAFGTLPDGRQYYVMELLDGAGFDALIKQKGRLTPREAVPILRGVARALDAAHKSGIVHRDLKPENVYLVPDEDGNVTPKLLDFGIAKLAADGAQTHKTKTGTAMGTPYYMSPEQTRGVAVDFRTDIYSFGVMAFEALTGELPFRGESAMDILLKHLHEAVPLLSSREPSLAPGDVAIVRMMAKEPEQRFASAGEAALALAAAFGLAPDAVASQPALLASLQASSAPLSGASTVRGVAPPASASPTAKASPPGAPAADGPADAHAQTFLSSETDVVRTLESRTAPRSPLPIVVGVLALVVGVGLASFLVMHKPAGASLGDSPSATAPAPSSLASAMVATTAAAPTNASSAAPVDTVAPPPATVKVSVDATPAGAQVFLDGKLLGSAPGPFDLPKGKPATLTLRASGYQTATVDVAGAPDERATLSLRKLPSGTGATKINKDLEAFP